MNTHIDLGQGNEQILATYWEVVNSASGTITFPAGSELVQDAFQDLEEAVVSKVLSSKPTFEAATSSGGSRCVCTLDSFGAYSISPAPSSYPVAILYRVKQPLSTFNPDNAVLEDVERAGGGLGIPTGGTTGQALLKQSNTDGDADWETISQADPSFNTTTAYQKRSVVFDDWTVGNALGNYSPTLGRHSTSSAALVERLGMTPMGIGDIGWTISGNSQEGGFRDTTNAIRITKRPAANQTYIPGLVIDVETRLQVIGTIPTANFATLWFGLLQGGLNNSLFSVSTAGHAGFGAGGGPSDIPAGIVGNFYFRRKNAGDATSTYTDLGLMDANPHIARIRFLVNNDLTMTVTAYWDNVEILSYATHEIGTTIDHYIWAGMASASSGYVASWGVRFDYFRVISERL